MKSEPLFHKIQHLNRMKDRYLGMLRGLDVNTPEGTGKALAYHCVIESLDSHLVCAREEWRTLYENTVE